jgi:two-component system cell cycle sensor histidine kinase/response regulator CckA
VPDDESVRLRVSDTRTGMPADVIAHVFEPFFTTKGHDGGTGLGLATVYGIVTQSERTIGIRSEPGAGTTFTIMLPVIDKAAATATDALTLAASHGKDIHLLVTDVVMPKMLGKEVAERIREFQPGIEVLYMSG